MSSIAGPGATSRTRGAPRRSPRRWHRNLNIAAAKDVIMDNHTNGRFTGTQYAQQSCKVSDALPFKWINKKWKEGFPVTAMATTGIRWAVVMSRNAGFSDQVAELDFLYPSEGIHRRWDSSY